MQDYEMKKVSIHSLLLSNNNPRLDASFEEYEAILKMINNQKDKLYVLASDIAEHGLNPLEIIGVYPSDLYVGLYVVGEGNRRVTALKLLNNPSILQDINHALFSKFKKISNNNIIDFNIDVAVFKNEKEMQHWIEIRHKGEQKGKGLSKWDSLQKARYNKRLSGSDILIDFFDWMEKENILTRDEINSVTKTNFERILRPHYLPFLKINRNKNYWISPLDIEIFKVRMKAVQKHLSGKNVGEVYDNAKIASFYDKVSFELYGESCESIMNKELEDIKSNKKDNEITTFVEEPIFRTEENDLENQSQKLNKTRKYKKKDLFEGCQTIIPNKYNIRSSNMRINQIIRELKTLNVDLYPNACGTLLRALFELSAKYYMEQIDGQEHTEDEFQRVIKDAANKLRSSNDIDNSQHSAICKVIDNLRKIFNGYMHNTDAFPSSEGLKNYFKSHHKFIEACLQK